MISIITCSRSKSDLQDLEKNIQDTVGVPYELIVIENPNGLFGLCRAYNKGASQARFSYLCYMHDDIRYESINWGLRLVEHLQDPTTGLIGVSGGIAKSDVPTDANSLFPKAEINFIQHYKYRYTDTTFIHSSYSKANAVPVVVLDGMWMASRKDVFEKISFDEFSFPGFHGYDIDYSLQVLRQYKLYVVYDILIRHFSEGNYTPDWVESASRVSHKWQNELPVYTDKFKPEDHSLLLFKSLKFFLKVLAKTGYGIGFMLQICVKYGLKKHFYPLVFIRSIAYTFRYKFF